MQQSTQPNKGNPLFNFKRVHGWIGKVPDRVVAEAFGCSVGTVYSYRKRNQIPTYRFLPGELKTAFRKAFMEESP